MALTGNEFAEQTAATTSQQVCCLEECDTQFSLQDDEFYVLMIDALQRLGAIDLTAIEAVDLKQVVENARCSLQDRTGFCAFSEQRARAVLLYLANQLLAA
jgi:hypothetical protein